MIISHYSTKESQIIEKTFSEIDIVSSELFSGKA